MPRTSEVKCIVSNLNPHFAHAGEQLKAALSGKVLLSVSLPSPWDRVVELSFGVRPGDAYTHRLLLEVRTFVAAVDAHLLQFPNISLEVQVVVHTHSDALHA